MMANVHNLFEKRTCFCIYASDNFYWKTARDTLHFDGIASGFAMFLHWMPDQVGHDVIAGHPGNLTGYQLRIFLKS